MSLNKLFVIFGIILVVFAGIVFFQFKAKPSKKSINSQSSSKSTPSVTIDGHTFAVDIADTPILAQKGLSGRSSLPTDHGMLFLFSVSDYRYFWMKDMKFPLDIIFINNDKIISIAKNAPQPAPGQTNLPLYKSAGPIDKVLEINAGLSDKYNFKNGDTAEVNIPKNK